MDPAVRQVVHAIHQASGKCSLVVTGGGVQAVAALLSIPGGSRTILEAIVPYNEQATIIYLGDRPEQLCSAQTARALATRAYERARRLEPQSTILGVGCTASLATDRPKHGDHRVHIAIRTAAGMHAWSLVLQKGARQREDEEDVVSRLLLRAVGEAFQVAPALDVPLLPGEVVDVEAAPMDPLSRFLTGTGPAVYVHPDGQVSDRLPDRPVLLPGAFNPVHEGHWRLAEVAARRRGCPVIFELSVRNVDKPMLAAAEVLRRMHQFAWRAPLVLTRAAAFQEKAVLAPGSTFVMGADTATRLAAVRYYGDSESAMLQSLGELRDRGCRFLVACRIGAGGKIIRLADTGLATLLPDLFEEIPPEQFLEPASSTELRQRGVSIRS